MAKNTRVLRRSLIATGIVLMAGTVWGQSSEAEMRVFPMPPSQGFKADKAFGFVGDYGYFESGSQPTATPSFQGLPSAQDYDYFRYTGFEGKNVYIYGAWGRIPIGPPTVNGDNCGHAHLSYGVWAKYRMSPWYSLFASLFPWWRTSGWVLLGGGGMSGVREAPSSPCLLSVDNPIAIIDNSFGWGTEVLNLDFRWGQMPLANGLPPGTVLTELVLGVQANTHGWGSCGSFACHMPSWSIAYTLP